MKCDEQERLTMRLGKHLQAAGASAVLVFGAGGVLDMAPGKEISTADPKIQEEIILARQGLMEGLYELLNDGESPENSTEATAMQANAEAVAASLPALKFLFPPETSPQHPNYKSSYPTYALPVIWEEFDRFSQHLVATTDAAHALANATDPARFPELARRLLAECEACHAAFRAPYQSPLDAPVAGPAGAR
jgi:cytochrome c556